MKQNSFVRPCKLIVNSICFLFNTEHFTASPNNAQKLHGNPIIFRNVRARTDSRRTIRIHKRFSTTVESVENGLILNYTNKIKIYLSD